MLKRRILYLSLFVFCTWLALATRWYKPYFPKIVVVYGGDVIWAGMFLFLLRIFFTRITLWKLALINYTLGVVIECMQLYQGGWYVQLRSTYLGKLMLGVGFVWSDLVCYAIGTLIAFCLVAWIERKPINT